MKVTLTVFVALICVHQLVLGQVLTMSACAVCSISPTLSIVKLLSDILYPDKLHCPAY